MGSVMSFIAELRGSAFGEIARAAC